MVLAVTYPWASASSFVTTAGDATPLWEDVTDPTCSGDRHRAFASSYLFGVLKVELSSGSALR